MKTRREPGCQPAPRPERYTAVTALTIVDPPSRRRWLQAGLSALLLGGAAGRPAFAQTAAADPPEPAPTHRTRIPAAARVSYRLSRSGISGSGELDWRPADGAYTLRLEGTLPIIGTLIVQTSRGGFDAAGLAPLRYTDKRLRRKELAASFDRAAGRIGFSGGQPEVALAAGAQDRLSVMLQLAAIANAWERPPPAGQAYAIPVVGARGDAQLWRLRYEGRQSVSTPDGAVDALRFLREPERPRDTRAEFWLDPTTSHLPVRVRLTDGDGDALELQRIGHGP